MNASDVAQISLFADLDESACERIAGLFQEEKVLPGRRPAIQGDFGYRFFVILEGTAVVRVDGEEVRTLGPGDFFGELALLGEEGRRTAEVEATTDMRYASVLGWDFRELLEELPGVSEKIEAAVKHYRA
jgi:CRP-like cAMP-binding protein